ncbi:hypothetical protein M0802_015788 [Mischocyttarus mexicanus]|nr:hypothetical protein M0802_015788 [Mischocyttarus mexicanus]
MSDQLGKNTTMYCNDRTTCWYKQSLHFLAHNIWVKVPGKWKGNNSSCPWVQEIGPESGNGLQYVVNGLEENAENKTRTITAFKGSHN